MDKMCWRHFTAPQLFLIGWRKTKDTTIPSVSIHTALWITISVRVGKGNSSLLETEPANHFYSSNTDLLLFYKRHFSCQFGSSEVFVGRPPLLLQLSTSIRKEPGFLLLCLRHVSCDQATQHCECLPAQTVSSRIIPTFKLYYTSFSMTTSFSLRRTTLTSINTQLTLASGDDQ